MKNILVITGGAGFVGSNLINHLIKKTTYKIISIDNYSSGSKKNHIKNSRVKYIKGDTKNIDTLKNKYNGIILIGLIELFLFSLVNILTNVKMQFFINVISTYEPYPAIVQKLKASNIFIFPQAKHSMCVLKDGVKLIVSQIMPFVRTLINRINENSHQ